MLSKAQLRSTIQGMIGDKGQLLWDKGALDVLIELTIDELWGELLEANPQFVSELETITTITAPGYIDTSTLSQRLFRVTKLVRGGRQYRPADSRDVVVEDNTVRTAPAYSYTLFGDQLWMFPLDSSTEIELRYNYLPTRFTTLADVDTVEWVDGYYSALALEVAGRALISSEVAQQLLSVAERSMGRMRAAAERRLGAPRMVYLEDSPVEWGGS